MRAPCPLALAVLVSCASPAPPDAAPRPRSISASPAPRPRAEIDAGAAEIFRAAGVGGAFVLLDVGRDLLTFVNPDEAMTRHLPASTFKIPNTLIGLDTGVIPDERFHLTWDGKKRDVDAWNRDHDLSSAMKRSVVWFYQEVARRVGHERMRRHVEAFDYGSRDIGGDGAIDRFWLTGPLEISPLEQVDFLALLRAGRLPVKAEHVALVRRLVTIEERPGLLWQGKTGLGEEGDRAVGWLVGFVERDGASYVYATLLLTPKRESSRLIPLRRELTRKLFTRRGLL